MKNKSISIILPTFNERGNITKLIFSLFRILGKEKIKPEIIVIDDNSPDGTAQAVRELDQKIPIKIFVRKKNKSLALSIKRGIRESSGEVIVLMDTDFNHKPGDVPRLLNALEKNNADLVIGSRYIRGGKMMMGKTPKLKYFSSKLFNLFVKYLHGILSNENLSGFLAIRRYVFTEMPLSDIFRGYGDYCIRLIIFTYRKGYKINEIPVTYGSRNWGESKTKLFKHLLAYLMTTLELKFKKK